MTDETPMTAVFETEKEATDWSEGRIASLIEKLAAAH